MKLSIGLIPRTAFYNNVRSIVSKKEWDIIRKTVYKEANYVCEICGGKGKRHPVECHEIWDYDSNNFQITLTGFIALCPSCHSCKHWGLSQIRGLELKCYDHYCKVNNIDFKTAQRLVINAFETWSERSKYKWNVNIDYAYYFIKEKNAI